MASQTGNMPALESRVRQLMSSELQEATESCRTWKLGCIQAEAERRNLLSQADSTTRSGSVSPSSSPSSVLRRPGWWPQAIGSDGASFADSPTDAASPISQAEAVELALAKVLAFERHIDDLSVIIAGSEEEAAVIREGLTEVEAKLADRRVSAENAAQLASAERAEAEAMATSQQVAREQHNRKCAGLVEEARVSQADAGSKEDVEVQLGGIRATRDQLAAEVQVLEDDLDVSLRRQESLRMCFDEALTKRTDMVDLHAESTKEAAAAKHAAQARGAALSRLQGEVLRTRSKSERKRRLLGGQLVQCRAEMAEAVDKATIAGEKLRKLKQQQGKQLRDLRSETDGLQAEVDEHLNAIENSEASASALRVEEAELVNDRHRHIHDEQAFEAQAEEFRSDAIRLEHEVEAQEATQQLSLARLSKAEDELREEEHLAEALRADAQELQRSTEAAVATQQQLRSELGEEQHLCGLQGEALELKETLEAKVEALRAKNADLSDDYSELEESARKSNTESVKHFSDMDEAVQRTLRLKAQHSELVGPTNARGREALTNSMDQAFGRMAKKADAVISCLEFLGPGSSGNRSSRGSDAQQAASLSQRSHVALQRRLQAEYEKRAEALLAEERRNVVLEQQRSLTEARQRSSELQRVRQERRSVQEELAKCPKAQDLSRGSDIEFLGLEAQVKLVDQEAADGTEAVTAEFSDLLQKQALERDVLLAQVEELRRQVDGGGSRMQDETTTESIEEEDDGTSDTASAMPSAAVLQRLAQVEAEAGALWADEEELLQAHVKLKAAVFGAQQRLRDNAGKPTSSVETLPVTEKMRAVSVAAQLRGSAAAQAFAARRNPPDVFNPRRASSSGARSHSAAATAVLVASQAASPSTGSPKTPTKSNSREGLGSPKPSPTASIVCSTDIQEAAASPEAGGESATSPNPVFTLFPAVELAPSVRQQVHQRVVSISSSASLPRAEANLAGHISGSIRSVSSNSHSTSGSQNSTVLGRPPGRDVAEVHVRGGATFPAGAFRTWPSGMHQHSPSLQLQDAAARDAMDPRFSVTLN